jgi:tRNA pseudouridine55 synthase
VTSGFLIIDKPPGVTSFSMVALVRRVTGVRRVGHAGTLDPLASGVLPVAVGPATRLIEYLDDALKTYVASVRFGVATDTYDAEGQATFSDDASSLTAEAVRDALAGFEGDIEQVPPAFSALKVAGKPMYTYAREGRPVAPVPRRVRISRIELIAFDAADSTATIEVECGKGTYIRSLAHDLGRRLGPGAHLTGLRRTGSGGFTVDDARTPEAIASAAESGGIEDLMLAADRAVERRPAAILGVEHSRAVVAGRNLALAHEATAGGAQAAASGGVICRAYAVDGRFLGLLSKLDTGVWHPEKVLDPGPNVPDSGNLS